MLELKNLSFSADGEKGTVEILRDISLKVEDGKFVVITGPNGGGKTTLAKTIMGLNRATSGQILWDGEDITELSITERARRGISYGFQQPPRFKGLRVRDLLSLASGNHTLSQADACQLLTRVGLCAADYIDREVDAIPVRRRGQAHRDRHPSWPGNRPLMIFDEPEAGIDLWSFAKLTETFRYIHDKREATIIIISHQERIINLADEIVIVSDGRITDQGPKDELFPEILANTQSACTFVSEEAGA